MQALASDKPEAWKSAIATELDKLTERGVFLHNQTSADLLAHSIKTKVVPRGLYLTENTMRMVNSLGRRPEQQ